MGIRPTFMGFEASKSALFASQKGLDIVGQNLANMSSEGYTRQRVDQVSVDTYAYRNRKNDTSYTHIGMGTTVNGVQQVRDERMDTAFRQSYADTSYFSKGSDMYSEIETIISEIDEGTDGTGHGLSWGLKEMYSSLEELSNNVNVSANATIFADAVNNVTSLLNRTAATLEESRMSYIDEIRTEVNDANTILGDVAVLNKQIRDVMSGAGYSEQYGPNELLDKRNVLLDELSAFGKLDVVHQSDGTVTVSLNGHECVKGDTNDVINFTENEDRTVTVKWKSNSEYADNQNGILKASTEIINGRGFNGAADTESSGARGFKYYEDSLDAFASKLAEVLNSTIPNEFDNEGNVVSYKKLVGEYVEGGFTDVNGKQCFTNVNKKPTAANITISDELFQDPTYVLTDKNSSDNKYYLDLIDKLSNEKQTFENGSESYEGTFHDFIREYSSKVADDVSYSKARYEACEDYSNELQDNRENITGVSETEETVSMLTYNRAFQAAAKMMTTMDELLDVIINQVGALG